MVAELWSTIPVLSSCRWKNSWTAFHYAAAHGHSDMVTSLVSCLGWADVKSLLLERDEHGNTQCKATASDAHCSDASVIQTAKPLLEQLEVQAKLELFQECQGLNYFKEGVNEIDPDTGATPLINKCEQGQLGAVIALLKLDVDITLVDKVSTYVLSPVALLPFLAVFFPECSIYRQLTCETTCPPPLAPPAMLKLTSMSISPKYS